MSQLFDSLFVNGKTIYITQIFITEMYKILMLMNGELTLQGMQNSGKKPKWERVREIERREEWRKESTIFVIWCRIPCFLCISHSLLCLRVVILPNDSYKPLRECVANRILFQTNIIKQLQHSTHTHTQYAFEVNTLFCTAHHFPPKWHTNSTLAHTNKRNFGNAMWRKRVRVKKIPNAASSTSSQQQLRIYGRVSRPKRRRVQANRKIFA